ncbi:MAG: sulfotransferase family protein [Pseudomonadota bacterium]
MALRVIGAGFGRTGTLSLKFALERLGFDACYHMLELHKHPEHRELWAQAHRGENINWDALFDGYQASVDWPSCNLWREQLAHFPDAKVILSLRDPDRWYDSVMATIYQASSTGLSSADPERKAGAAWAHDIIWNRVFDNRMTDRDHVISVFNAHNEAVRAEVPADKLLVFEASAGWNPLCEFLQVAVPDEDYPRVNSTEEFSSIWQQQNR